MRNKRGQKEACEYAWAERRLGLLVGHSKEAKGEGCGSGAVEVHADGTACDERGGELARKRRESRYLLWCNGGGGTMSSSFWRSKLEKEGCGGETASARSTELVPETGEQDAREKKAYAHRIRQEHSTWWLLLDDEGGCWCARSKLRKRRSGERLLSWLFVTDIIKLLARSSSRVRKSLLTK